MGSAHPLVRGGELQCYELKKLLLEMKWEVFHRCKRILLGECYMVGGALLQDCLDLVRNVSTLLKK